MLHKNSTPQKFNLYTSTYRRREVNSGLGFFFYTCSMHRHPWHMKHPWPYEAPLAYEVFDRPVFPSAEKTTFCLKSGLNRPKSNAFLHFWPFRAQLFMWRHFFVTSGQFSEDRPICWHAQRSICKKTLVITGH